MMRFEKILLVIMLAIALASTGCNQTIESITPTVHPTEKPTQAITPTLHPEPTPTNTPQENTYLTEQCPTILPSESLSEVDAEGVIVLLGELGTFFMGRGRRAFLLDLETQERIELSSDYPPDDAHWTMAVSPDHKTLAYTMDLFESDSVELVLSNSIGERQKVIVFENDELRYMPLGGSRYWLNNQQLSSLFGEIVFNPYTEDVQIYDIEDFPGISPGQFQAYKVIFDPQLSRAIYFHQGEIALIDLVTKQVLTEIPAYFGIAKAGWSPDSNFAAVVARWDAQDREELFIVNCDGNHVEQITQLALLQQAQQVEYYELHNPSWSPDGSRIAFWQAYFYQDTGDWRLFVLDVKTGELTSYCTWGEKQYSLSNDLVWSSDGKQLSIAYYEDDDSINTMIIDLEKNIAIPVADDIENVIPVGWMVSP